MGAGADLDGRLDRCEPADDRVGGRARPCRALGGRVRRDGHRPPPSGSVRADRSMERLLPAAARRPVQARLEAGARCERPTRLAVSEASVLARGRHGSSSRAGRRTVTGSGRPSRSTSPASCARSGCPPSCGSFPTAKASGARSSTRGSPGRSGARPDMSQGQSPGPRSIRHAPGTVPGTCPGRRATRGRQARRSARPDACKNGEWPVSSSTMRAPASRAFRSCHSGSIAASFIVATTTSCSQSLAATAWSGDW